MLSVADSLQMTRGWPSFTIRRGFTTVGIARSISRCQPDVEWFRRSNAHMCTYVRPGARLRRRRPPRQPQPWRSIISDHQSLRGLMVHMNVHVGSMFVWQLVQANHHLWNNPAELQGTWDLNSLDETSTAAGILSTGLDDIN